MDQRNDVADSQSLLTNGARFRLKEPFCALSHYTGAVLSVGALVLLLGAARGRPLPTLAAALYGGSLIALYLASALSHTWHAAPRVQTWLSRADYVGIFLLIAGTYAPMCLVSLRGPWGRGLLSVEYGLAVVGIANVLFTRTPHWMRVPVYAVMGWLAVVALGPLQRALPPAALHWLFAGGAFYTGGLAILALDRPHLWPGRFSAHDLWHVCVLAGSACHFVLIYLYVLGGA